MKCMKCNKNEANVYISKNINGKVTKQCLCSECAKDVNMKQFVDIDKVLARMFNSNEMFNRSNSMFDTFFDDFAMIDNMFEIPEIIENSEEEDTIRIDKNNQVGSKKVSKERKESIDDLKHQLEIAIKEERYEDAAVLRDKIAKGGI